MSMKSNALVESVAQALSWAISDPSGHPSLSLPRTRRRGIEETRRAATVFDSSAIPPITVEKYLMRLSSTFRCSDSTFIAALIIVERLLGYDGGRLPLTERNVHRIFLASLVVAVKYHEDFVYTNSHYAKCGGVHLREVNRLERTILQSLDFDLGIEPDQYKIYEDTLQSMSDPGIPADVLEKPAAPDPPKVTEPVAKTTPAQTGQEREAPAAGVPGEKKTGEETQTAPAAKVSEAEKTGYVCSMSPCLTGNHLARTREARDSRTHPKDRNRCAPVHRVEPSWTIKELSVNGDPAHNQEVTFVSWAQPPQRAILGLDMAVMVTAAAGDGSLQHPRPSKA